MDVGELVGFGKTGVVLTSDLASHVADFNVVIDFTAPSYTLSNVALCRRYGQMTVVGTTGFTADQKTVLEDAGNDIPLVFAPRL